jgi:hypothetical protein
LLAEVSLPSAEESTAANSKSIDNPQYPPDPPDLRSVKYYLGKICPETALFCPEKSPPSGFYPIDSGLLSAWFPAVFDAFPAIFFFSVSIAKYKAQLPEIGGAVNAILRLTDLVYPRSMTVT